LKNLENMALLNLPNETLLLIAESLSRACDIFSFALVTRRTYFLLLPTLYKFNIEQENASALSWAAQRGRSLMAKTMLQRYQYDVNTVYRSNTPLIHAVSHRQTGSKAVVEVLLVNYHINVNFQNERGQCALWWAAYRGYTDIVEQLLQRDDIQVDNPDRENHLTPLGVATVKGHDQVVQRLLRTRRVDVNKQDRNGQTLILSAVERGHKRRHRRIIEMLVKDGEVDLSCRDVEGFTPLLCSIGSRQTDVTRMLLSHPRPYVNVRDSDDRTPLWHAVRVGNEETVQLLLEKGADTTTRDVEGMTPLHLAIKKGNLSILQTLLGSFLYGPSAFFLFDEDRDESDEEPLLCLAAAWKRSEMVQLLLDHGWNVNEEDAEALTPLLLAAKEGYSSVVQVLLNHPQINLHAQDHCGSTALHAAAKEGHLEVVKLLLTEGSIDVNVKDKDGVTPLWWATQNRHDELAALLLAQPNVDVNAVSQLERPFPDRSTSLHHTVQARDVRIMRLLLTKEDLDPNVADHQKWTPLCWAASQGDVEMVDLLLTRPEIRINGVEGEEVPPLCLAAREGHTQVVRRLLQYPGIGMDQAWGAYLPPLLAAITTGHSDVAMQLLASGKQLNVNIQTYATESALSLAARHGDLQVVNSILCDSRTDRNSVDDWGRTALWWAAHTGKSAVVERFLLDDNIQVDIRDDDGIDALNAASKQYHFDIVKLLRTHRAEHHHGVGGSRPLMASN
jgi:serine/threonine-protein phosphatase 6 regulatory ankyrin repeat subunit B